MKKYYHESVGECVSQVYEIEATTWEEAKQKAFSGMKEGDHIAECPPSAVKKDGDYPDYHYIDQEQCTNYATLCKGTWAQREPSGMEYWESRAWFFDDDPETFLNSNGEEFDEWEQDEEDEE